MRNRLKRLISLDWDAIAGVLAAVTALVLRLLHLVEPGILVTIILVILALLLIRDLRRERGSCRSSKFLADGECAQSVPITGALERIRHIAPPGRSRSTRLREL
jgi:hypothetical protein